jgi:hypothetical protein
VPTDSGCKELCREAINIMRAKFCVYGKQADGCVRRIDQ